MQPVRLSKLLSRVLRHDPRRVGVALDEQGWVDVSELVLAIDRSGFACSRADIEDVVRTSDKRHFTIDRDTDRIRADQRDDRDPHGT